MRITKIELEIEDIEWYAIDELGHIARFTSGGSQAVPEFICKSREELEIISHFMQAVDHKKSPAVVFTNRIESYRNKDLTKECENISNKGIFVYDIVKNDNDQDKYQLLCKPEHALLLNEFPDEIQKIVNQYKLNNICYNKHTIISIQGAYK